MDHCHAGCRRFSNSAYRVAAPIASAVVGQRRRLRALSLWRTLVGVGSAVGLAQRDRVAAHCRPLLADHSRRRRGADPGYCVPDPGVRRSRLCGGHRLREDGGSTGGAAVVGAARRVVAVGRLARRRSVHGGCGITGDEGPAAVMGSRAPAGCALWAGCGWTVRVGIDRHSWSYEGARRGTDRDARNRDVGSDEFDADRRPRRLLVGSRTRSDSTDIGPLAIQCGGRRAECVRVRRVGAGAGAGECGEGSHAGPGGAAVHLRRLALVAEGPTLTS